MTDFFLPLFTVLVIILSVAIIYHRFDFMEPAVFLPLVMTVSTFLSLIMAERWGLSITFKGFVFTIAALFAFLLGGYFARKCLGSDKKVVPKTNSYHTYDIGNTTVLIATVVMLVMLFLNAHLLYTLSLKYGNVEGIAGYLEMIRVIRPYVESNQLPSFGWQFGVRLNISRLIAYVFAFLFAYNFLYSKSKRVDLKLLIPVVLEIPFQILTTGRLGLLIVISYLVVVTLILYQKGNNYSLTSKLNALKVMGAGGFLFVCMFLLIGMLTWKGITSDRTPLVILSHYAGLSVPAFDRLLDMSLPEAAFIGTHTLFGVYRILHAIFASIPPVDVFLPFVQFNGINTNVYTMFGQYFMDYGYLGTLAISWILGFLYSLFYSYIKFKENNIALPVVMYSYFAYPMFLSSISERFLMDFTNTAGMFAVILFISLKIIFRER